MERPENCILIIFGASGDLTKRKLMPSLFDLYQKNLLPNQFAILGTGRTEFSDVAFREKIYQDILTYSKVKFGNQDRIRHFLNHIQYQPLDSKVLENFKKLKDRLSIIDKEIGAQGRFIYYLATSPNLFEVIFTHLGRAGLTNQSNTNDWKRIVIEKPFGYDYNSAKLLNTQLQIYFHENQIYRIDHYLGKETVQNILAFRFANGIFEPLWNRNYIHHVEITAAESIGIENRGSYYDSAGALRDMVQNHLLQILATVAIEPPSRFEANALRNEKIKLFQSFCQIRRESVSRQTVRGQYLASIINNEEVPGYLEEKNVAQNSRTETFIAMKMQIDNWRWGGVPFYIRTGKRMPTRVSEVVVHFKKTPHHLFTRQFPTEAADNQLIIRIQPDEGIMLKFGMKMPGTGFQIKDVDMDFHYSDLNTQELPDAYERLLLDCMIGDATLFARADAVEACWDFITPILNSWENDPEIPLFGYPAGNWGPVQARELFMNNDEDWHYPCKNLIEEDNFCQL